MVLPYKRFCFIFSVFCFILLPFMMLQNYRLSTSWMLLCYLHAFMDCQDLDVKQTMVLTSVLNQSSEQNYFSLAWHQCSGIFCTWEGSRKNVTSFEQKSFVRRQHINVHTGCFPRVGPGWQFKFLSISVN